MESRAKILGHAIHPIMIVFPLGLLSTGVIFDILFLITGTAALANAAYWMMVSGIIGGVLAALFGFIDWTAIPNGTRAKYVGLIHGGLNAGVLAIFAIIVYLRTGSPEQENLLATALGVFGFLLALAGGWFGGELVERLGVGVHPGAHLNAPNSLTEDMPEVNLSTKATRGV